MRDLPASILRSVEVAIVVVDSVGDVVFANPYASTLFGLAGEEMSPDRLRGLIVDWSQASEALAAESSSRGTFDIRRPDGTVITVHAMTSHLYDDEVTVAGDDDEVTVAGAVTVTWNAEQERAAELLAQERTRAAQVSQFLADCSVAVGSSTNYEDGLTQLGRRCVPFLADICLIDAAEGHEVRRVVAAHHRADQRRLMQELEASYSPDPAGEHPAVAALRTGKASMSAQMSDEFLRLTTQDDEHLRIVKELNFQSYICVPLMARGRILGALTLVSCDAARRYGKEDLRLAREVAWRVSLLLDNARLFSESSHVAKVLQASLLPASLPEIPGIELAARYVAFGAGIDVGGDFYDVYSASYGAYVLTLGDVCGRGPEAAVTTGLIRHTLRSAVLKVRDPGQLVAMANEVLLRDATASEGFTTLLCGILRPRPGSARLSLANAGHPPPIVVRANGTVDTPTYGDRMIGVFDDATWRARSIELAAGDVLVAYTDGITEARREGELFGEERLVAVVQAHRGASVEAIADEVIASVRTFAGEEPADDLALIALRVSAPGGEEGVRTPPAG